jgi:mono/diheme cytochrome c family protein
LRLFHGSDGRGGEHYIHMWPMDAPDIRYKALSGEADAHGSQNGVYALEDFRQAVVYGRHADGERLDPDMPRWQLNDQDLADLFEYLKTLP